MRFTALSIAGFLFNVAVNTWRARRERREAEARRTPDPNLGPRERDAVDSGNGDPVPFDPEDGSAACYAAGSV